MAQPQSEICEIPLITSETLCPLVSTSLEKLSPGQWRMIAVGDLDSLTGTVLAETFMQTVQSVSTAILNAVMPVAYQHITGSNSQDCLSADFFGVSEERIHASLGDSLAQSFTEVLTGSGAGMCVLLDSASLGLSASCLLVSHFQGCSETLCLTKEQQANEAEVVVFSVPSYACQRRTTLENQNTVLTDALSLLAENAELSEEDGRGVAFRRAAAVLKALPKPVTAMRQLKGLPCLGEHSLRVIKDILENGASSEVESTKQSERFKALKVLTGIFGVGAKTADRWIREGLHNIHQLQDSGQTLNRAQQAGLEHYDDLNQPVTKAEADAIGEIVEKAVVSVLPGAQMTLIGGFRRGKLTGHDVDFLITHPEEGREVGLMPKVVSWLESQGFLLYQKTTRNSYLESKDGPARPASNMDRFERCFSVFKLTKEEKPGTKHPETPTQNGVQTLNTPEDTCSLGAHVQADPNPQSHSHTLSHASGEDERLEVDQTKPAGHRPWRAVRVDLVVSPISQFAFALLGWTGSKLFERELRRWAGHEKAMSLSSHALYDNKQSRYLRATSEEEIFAHLGLEYIPPSERNA